MDSLKKATVLKIISALWGHPVSKLSELKNGHYYLHVLSLLEQWNKNVDFDNDVDRICCIKTFLQEYYGDNVKLEEFCNFDMILNANATSAEVEMELAKVAIVLFGIGVLDKNGQHFISSAMQLPSNMHMDVITIIQSVVQAGTKEISLTSNIEKVLREPSAEKMEQCLSPVCGSSSFTSQTSTPKKCSSGNLHEDSPFKNDRSLLCYSFQDITSPLRGLSIDASLTSPLAQFAQSPQLIHKASLNQKELELSKLKQQLNDLTYLKEEMQFTIQDYISQGILKDSEISKLQKRVKDLIHLQDSYDELQEMKVKYRNMELEISKLHKIVKDVQVYKEQMNFLEKENNSQRTEINQLLEKITSLQLEKEQYLDSLKTVTQLESQVKTLDLLLAEVNKSKQECTEEREVIKAINAQLRQELLDLKTSQEENAPGENMGVCLELQLGELNCQLEEVKQERDRLLEKLNQISHSNTEQNEEIEKLKISVSEKEEICLRLTETEKEVENLKALVDKLHSDALLNTSLLSEAKKSKDEISCELTKTCTEMSKLIVKVNELNNEIKSKQEMCAKKEEKIAEQSDHIKHLTKKMSCVQDELRAKDEHLRTLTKSVNNLQAENSHLQSIKYAELNELSVVKEQLKKSEGFYELFKHHEKHLQIMRENNSCLSKALRIEQDTNAKLQKHLDDEASKFTMEVNRFNTALSYSERKVREYQHQLEQAGTALLGNATHFHQTSEDKGYHPAIMSCPNEPDGQDFEWNRLSELQRRNSMYPAHMRSAYPVEMQAVEKERITDDTLRMSLLPNTMFHTAPVYQRLAPCMPGRQRMSVKCTPPRGVSPVVKGKFKSHRSPYVNSRRTPHKHTPHKSPRANYKCSESVAFNIGFTPKKNNGQRKHFKRAVDSKIRSNGNTFSAESSTQNHTSNGDQ